VAKRFGGLGCHLVRRSASARPHCVRCEPNSSKRNTPAPPPSFRPCLLWPNDWMDQDVIWYGDRPRPRPSCVRWKLSSPPTKGAQPPLFGRCLLWPNSRPSQQLLSSCYSRPLIALAIAVDCYHSCIFLFSGHIGLYLTPISRLSQTSVTMRGML